MGRTIIKLTDDAGADWYLEWSSVADGPATVGMSRADFETYYREWYGRNGMAELPARMAHLDAKGTSSLDDESAFDVLTFNRAGKGETCLTPDQLIEVYCKGGENVEGHRHNADDRLAYCDGRGDFR